MAFRKPSSDYFDHIFDVNQARGICQRNSFKNTIMVNNNNTYNHSSNNNSSISCHPKNNTSNNFGDATAAFNFGKIK